MNKLKRCGIIFLSCMTLSTATTTVFTANTIIAEAHSGRTDANGGHRDNKNKSGLGSYHYHCNGHPLIVKVVVSKNLYSCFDRLSDIVLYLT